MPEDAGRKGLEGHLFMAVKSRGVVVQNLLISFMFVTCGFLVMALAFFLVRERGSEGLYLFIGALGLVAVVLGTEVGVHTWPMLRTESIVVDLRSARLLEEGHVQREVVFGQGTRIGIVVNQVFHVPELKPLYGIEFEGGGRSILLSPSEGYDLDYVRRLWPFALAITRLHGLGLTEAFKRHLRSESGKGGYWAGLYDELLGEEDVPLVKKEEASKEEEAPGEAEAG